jgi:hypothetical protein
MAQYGDVTAGGVTCDGRSVTLDLPVTGTRLVTVTGWGVINLNVIGSAAATGKIMLCIEKYGEPAIAFEIDSPGMYRIKNGYLSLPLEAFAEMQQGFQTVTALAIQTRQKLNVLLGLPENDGLDFDDEPEGLSEGAPESGGDTATTSGIETDAPEA